MKTLYLIGGTMGVGKTAVSQQLKKDLPNSVFLDGDWCWDGKYHNWNKNSAQRCFDVLSSIIANVLCGEQGVPARIAGRDV